MPSAKVHWDEKQPLAMSGPFRTYFERDGTFRLQLLHADHGWMTLACGADPERTLASAELHILAPHVLAILQSAKARRQPQDPG
jgi:hypothetical protein